MSRYPGSLRRHGRGWQLRLCVGGQRHTFTVRTAEKREAQQFAKAKRAELEHEHERQQLGLVTGIRFSGLLAQYERDELPGKAPGTQAAYRDSFKPLRVYFIETLGDPEVAKVRTGHVEGFIAWRRGHRITSKEGADGRTTIEAVPRVVHERTVAKDRAVLHSIFALGKRWQYRDGNPVEDATVPKADPRTPVLLSDEQLAALLRECTDPVTRLYVLVLAETGIRDESEALWLRWEDVDLAAGDSAVISGRDGHLVKGGKSRYGPLTLPLVAALRQPLPAARPPRR